jgi:putative acetyltransferase
MTDQSLVGDTTIVRFRPEYAQAFHDLNVAWLSTLFTVEPAHLVTLEDPEGTIIAGGGEIFFGLQNDEPVGTIALKSDGQGVFELTKLGVSPHAQGGGLGRALCEAVISEFSDRGGRTLYLETHSKLAAALRIYQKLGFQEMPNPNAGLYAGTDMYMEWVKP